VTGYRKRKHAYGGSPGRGTLRIRPRNAEAGNIGCFMDMYYNMILDMDAIN